MEDLDVEWTVEGFLAECDAVQANPPEAPPGMERVECGATPPHWPTYMAHVDGQYGAPCYMCISSEQTERIAELKHRSHHRWWKWRAYRWLSRRGYSWGLTAGSTWGNMCAHCGTTTQIHWRGKRSYILGQPREWWQCLVKRHHIYTPLHGRTFDLCTKCAPCPDCGSTAADHEVCGAR